jgi:hypothetical protein
MLNEFVFDRLFDVIKLQAHGIRLTAQGVEKNFVIRAAC